MLVPEATVNENGLLALGEGDIGFSRKMVGMNAKPVTERIQELSHRTLRLGVLRAYRAHDLASLFGSKLVWHGLRCPKAIQQRADPALPGSKAILQHRYKDNHHLHLLGRSRHGQGNVVRGAS